MKKGLLVLALLCLSASLVSAQTINDATIEYMVDTTGFSGSPSSVAYNPTTSNFLICDYAEPAVRIASGVDGSLTGDTLSLNGLTMGTLGVFSICVADDGVIYGGANPDLGDGETVTLIRWANESDTNPTEQEPAPLIIDDSTTFMEFPRAMDATGSGVNTVIGVTGGAGLKFTLLTTSDGTTFQVSEASPDGGILTQTDGTTPYEHGEFKQGIALVPSEALSRVYGTKADGAGEVAAAVKSGTQWVALDTFDATASYANLGAASPIGYVPIYDELMVLGFDGTTSELFSILDAQTGALVDQFEIPINVGTFGYGAIHVDVDAGEAYVGARGTGTGGSAVLGVVTFSTPGPTPTPTATPVVTDIRGNWNDLR
jgi:hypothetical protein